MSDLTSALSSRIVNLKECILTGPQLKSRSDSNPKFDLLRDLRPLIKSLTIYENLTSMTLTGTLILQDDVSLSTLVPLIGMESVNLKFSILNPRTGQEIDYEPLRFRIYNQTNRLPISQSLEKYRLGLVSPEHITALEKRISKTYSMTRIEDIVRDILTSSKYLQSQRPLNIQQTENFITFTVPYLNLLETIKLFTMMGLSTTSESSYFFYETLERFNFESLQQIIRREKSKPESERPVIVRNVAGIRTYKDTDRIFSAEDIDIVSGFDLLHNLSEGYFASTTVGVDVLSGKYRTTMSSINDANFKNKTRLNANPIYPPILGSGNFANPTSKIFLVPTMSISAKNQKLIQKDGDIRYRDNFIETTIDGRNRELLELQTRTVRVRLPGAPGIGVGKVVRIIIPYVYQSRKPLTDVEDAHTADYLIVAAKHTIENNGLGKFTYETTFEACTDSVRS